LYTCSMWYHHTLGAVVVAVQYTVGVLTQSVYYTATTTAPKE